MTDLPAPLTPADADLRDFPRMMIDVSRLRQSSFDAIVDDSAWRAGVNLWFSAWHAVPAGSLANDDASLAKAAGLGRDLRTWVKIKDDALRGFVLCSDGRLYHETVCEFVLEAWVEKLLQRISSGAGNAKRWSIDFDPQPIEDAITRAGELLKALSPGSRTLVKIRRKRSAPDPARNPTGTDNRSHREEKTIPLGSQETERGTGTGIIIEDDEDAGAKPAPAADPPNPFGPMGATTARLLRAGGVNVQPHHKRFPDQLDLVRHWTTLGLDVDRDIIPAIEQAVVDDPKDRHSLKNFDPMIARLAAQKEARSNGRSSHNGHGLGSTVQAGLDFAAEVEANRSHARRAG